MKTLGKNINGMLSSQSIDTFSSAIRQPEDTNETILLKAMFLYSEITAAQTHGVSNANEYFVPLENIGISKSREDENKKGLKWRSIADPKKAISYILLRDKEFGTRSSENYMASYKPLIARLKAEAITA